MTRLNTTTLAVLGLLLAAPSAQAAPDEGRQARSSGPNMPQSRDVVPSEIRPREPAAAGRVTGTPSSGGRSGWRDIERPPVRPPSP